MIVILCNSFQQAKEAFDLWVEYLEEISNYNQCEIKEIIKSCLRITMDDDLTYIFIDYRVKEWYQKMKPDFVEVAEFMEGIDYGYFSY